MGKINSKNGEVVNVEATFLENVDLSNGDYVSTRPNEHFGLILPEAGKVKILTISGSIGIHDLPAGYNPIACKAVFDVGSVVRVFTAYY